MKVLHVITTLMRGGAEKQVAALASSQTRFGLKVGVAWLKGAPELAGDLRLSGVRVFGLGLRAYGDPAPVLRLRKLLREYVPDVVHAHLQPAELYVRMALAESGPPLVCTRHNVRRFYPGPAANGLSRFCLARAGRIICPTRAVLDRVLAETGGQAESRVRLIPYGLPLPEVLDPIGPGCRQESEWTSLNKTALPSDGLILGYAARFVAQKNHTALLLTLARYRACSLRPAALILPGRGPLEEEVRRQALDMGLGDCVSMPGFLEDPEPFYASLDVYVSPSLSEGAGLSVLEAMRAGRPVLVSDIGAHRDLVAHNRSGLIHQPEAASLTNGLLSLENPIRRRELGEQGRRRVRDCFSLERVTGGLSMVYQDLCNSHV